MDKKLPYVVRALIEGSGVFEEATNAVRHAMAPLLGEFHPTDFPVVVAGIKLVLAALERLLDEDGRQLVDMIVNDTEIIMIDPKAKQ